jgi:hypothetical protein
MRHWASTWVSPISGIIMPTNKGQHYVPQFYLRNFSSDRNSIAFYSVKSSASFNTASIKGQCCKDYFYGKDIQPDKALREIETEAAIIIKKIISARQLPPKLSKDHKVLMTYVLLQHARTVNAGTEYDEAADRQIKHIFIRCRGDKRPEDLKGVRIKWDNAVKQSLIHTMEVYPLVLDLELLLITVDSGKYFITSDNPVVLYNQYLEERNYASNTGLQSIGLQMFFPLSPDCLLLCFDSWVYDIKPSNQRTIKISRAADVRKINELQLLNAVENIYFNPILSDSKVIDKTFNKIRERRRSHAINLCSWIQEADERNDSEFMGLFREDIKNDLELSFIRVNDRANKWKEEVMQRIVVRNQDLCDELRLFRGLVNKGLYQRGEFPKYLTGRVDVLRERAENQL